MNTATSDQREPTLSDLVACAAPSEKWPQIARAVSILSDQAIASATNFFTTLIVGRNRPPEELGLYALGMSFVFGLMNFPRNLSRRNTQIAALLVEHDHRVADHHKPLWRPLILELWHRIFVDGEPWETSACLGNEVAA